MRHDERRDLLVIVADLDAENVIHGLLGSQQEALKVSLDFNPASFANGGDIQRWNSHDPGCWRDAVALARSGLRSHRHILLMFDRDGSGVEHTLSRVQMQRQIQEDWEKNHLDLEACGVIVLDPELEAWAWSRPEKIASITGFDANLDRLQKELRQHKPDAWPEQEPFPRLPKEALELACRLGKRVKCNAPLFKKLAELKGIRACQDPAFQELRALLQGWFGKSSADDDAVALEG